MSLSHRFYSTQVSLIHHYCLCHCHFHCHSALDSYIVVTFAITGNTQLLDFLQINFHLLSLSHRFYSPLTPLSTLSFNGNTILFSSNFQLLSLPLPSASEKDLAARTALTAQTGSRVSPTRNVMSVNWWRKVYKSITAS